MRLLLGYDRDVAQFVAERIPHVASGLGQYGYGEAFGPGAAIGVLDGAGRLVAGVVYHNWQASCRNIELSFAADRADWLTRPLICGLLSYPFDQLNCNRITGLTPQRATRARQFLDHFGFKREGVVRFGFGDDHMIISGLLRKEWLKTRWAKPLAERRQMRQGKAEHGQEVAESAAGA